MRHKKLISLTPKHYEQLVKMMEEDGQESVSYFLGGLVAKEAKEREEYKSKKPVGRPRKENEEPEEEEEMDWSNDLPKTIKYYGMLIGAKQMAYLEAVQKEFQPK